MSRWPSSSPGGGGTGNPPAYSYPTSPVSSPTASSYPAPAYLPTSQPQTASLQYSASSQLTASSQHTTPQQYATQQYATPQSPHQYAAPQAPQQYAVQQYATQQYGTPQVPQQYTEYTPSQQQYPASQQYPAPQYAGHGGYQAASYLPSHQSTQQTYHQFQSPSLPISPPPTGNDPPLSLSPSWEDFRQRNDRHSREAIQQPQSLPTGFPVQFLQCKQAWTREVLSDPRNKADWLYEISVHDNGAIEDALRAFQNRGLAPYYISPDSFNVGEALGKRLRDIGAGLYKDRGIFLLRGLDINRYDEREIMIVHAGISSYIGSRRAHQRENDNVFAHIMDRSRDPGEDTSDMPLTSTMNEIGFHTDIGDIVSNLMIRPAANGGISYFASGTQVYNDLASKRPDIIHRLTRNWSFDIFPLETGSKPVLERPLLYNSGVHATMLCFRQPFVTSTSNNLRQGNLPEISSAQKEALDAIHYTAREKALALDLVRGDLVFVNNLLVLHARDKYTDLGMPRHVQRLIVRDPNESWRVPPGLKDIWGMIFGNPDHEWKNEVFNLDDLRDQRALWKLNG